MTLVLGICVGTPLAAAAQQVDEAYVVRASAAPCLRVRAQPRADAAPLACLVPGTRVTSSDVAPFWRRIGESGGVDGWAAKKFLEPWSDAAFLTPDATLPAGADTIRRWLEVHIVDVGQGDGIWIHTPDDGIADNNRYDGRNIVIDGGPDASDSKNAMLAYLDEYAHEGAVLDALIVSHPHDDHFPGADGLLRHFDVHRYYDPGIAKRGVAYPAFLESVRRERFHGGQIRVHRGTLAQLGALEWGAELDARFLYSYPGRPDGLGSGSTLENNASLVLRLQYGEHVFLFMGDAEGKARAAGPETPRYVEKVLLETVDVADLKATVLKLAHHGSETSSTVPFIEAVNPDVIIVSSGRRKYGPRFLPDASTLARYCTHNLRVRTYRTDYADEEEGRSVSDDADGDHIVVRTDGRRLEVLAYSNGARIPAAAADCP